MQLELQVDDKMIKAVPDRLKIKKMKITLPLRRKPICNMHQVAV
jgi:hypothetical protein